MRDRVIKTIERYRMLARGDRVGVAVSGGPDSVALLQVLADCSRSRDLSLVILHLNHGIRGAESDRDEAFVLSLGEQRGIPVDVKRVSIPGLKRRRGGTIEEIARNERYSFFRDAAAAHTLSKIAIGHTLNDQVETVLINMMRGSGPEGIRGMLPVREGIFIRPLIETTRDEVLAFLGGEGVPFITDATNAGDDYLRNRVRKYCVPAMEAACRHPVAAPISRMAEILRHEDDFMKGAAADTMRAWGLEKGHDEYRIAAARLREIHPALRRRVVKEILEDLSPGKNGIGYRHVQDVIGLIGSRDPRGTVSLPFSIAAVRDYDTLCIRRGGTDDSARRLSSKTRSAASFSCAVTIPGAVRIRETGDEFRFSFVERNEVRFARGRLAFMDYDALVQPVDVRNMHEGDRIQPLGMKGHTTLKSLCIDEKIPWAKRASMPIVADSLSVLWVPGVKLSERVRITDRTEKVVKVEII